MELDKKMQELEQIAKMLESGNVGFEEGIKLFENGSALAKECLMALTEAKGKITKIKQDLDAFKEEEIK